MTAGVAEKIDAMARLGFMLGRWRGIGWTVLERGRVEFEQQEVVRSRLSGEILTVEGSANDPGHPDDVRFTAFAIATYDPDTHSYRWRAYSAGSCVEVALEVDDRSYRWEFEAAPGVQMRFHGTVGTDLWHETGHASHDGGDSWSHTFEMNLTRLRP